ncbi:hypothetical protein OH76DRAFT_535987 [Lentinus brumalis]|uniref:Uncharacterized protein n=1 Tax=Lentinus brumalis TaxID=2498619 RepID=A0A371DAF1_9APHY|nr:hypothetical protein OH76DRAFT_535987 [Polyporus brumalis]
MRLSLLGDTASATSHASTYVDWLSGTVTSHVSGHCELNSDQFNDMTARSDASSSAPSTGTHPQQAVVDRPPRRRSRNRRRRPRCLEFAAAARTDRRDMSGASCSCIGMSTDDREPCRHKHVPFADSAAAGIQGLKQVVSMLVELLVVAPPHEPPQVPDPRPICACLGGDHVVRAAAGPFPCRHRRGARELLRSGRAAGFCDRVERRLSPSVGRLRDNGRTYLIVHNAK